MIVTKNYERNGHHVVELAGVMFSAGVPVARGTHTVIYQPGQAMFAFRGDAVAT
jgi:hypothetical protein